MAAGKKTGGRQAGTPNKITAEIKEFAQKYGREAIEVAAKIMRSDTAPEAARMSAVNTILDRAYGKAPQALEHTGKDGGPIETRNITDEMRAKALTAFMAKTGVKEGN